MKTPHKNKNVVRCRWAGDDPLMVRYHDHEWGVPQHNDRVLFEFLILEGAQAGLSWDTILQKRKNYRAAFDKFAPNKVARYDQKKAKQLMNNEGIVRNRLKIASATRNAKAFLAVQKEFGSFDKFIWGFTGGKTLVSRPKGPGDFQARTAESDAMSKELKKRGFRFVGSTICQAFMQAVGMRDDHMAGCFRAKK